MSLLVPSASIKRILPAGFQAANASRAADKIAGARQLANMTGWLEPEKVRVAPDQERESIVGGVISGASRIRSNQPTPNSEGPKSGILGDLLDVVFKHMKPASELTLGPIELL